MTIFSTTASLVVKDTCVGGCSVSWELDPKDNNSPSTYLIGTSYYARLHKVPTDLDITALITNGDINFYSSEVEDISDEIVTFSGSQVAQLDKPFYSALSYRLIGDAYDDEGNKLSSVSFEITAGTKEVRASVSCYAVLLVSYTTKYAKYRFSAPSEGPTVLVAWATCSDDTKAHATLSVEIKESGVSECLIATIEIDTSSVDGAEADTEGKKLFRVYASGEYDVYVTTGSLSSRGSKDEQVDGEWVVGYQHSFNASKPVYKLKSQTKKGGNLSRLYVENYQLKSVTNPDDAVVNGIPPGTGAYVIDYITRYAEYLISGNEGEYAEGVIVVRNSSYVEGSNCSEYFFQTFTLGVPEGVEKVDVTFLYKDFVTGEILPNAKVWVDNIFRGLTDANGEIFITGVSTDITHAIRATKEGYLNTVSDSLANDTFIARSE